MPISRRLAGYLGIGIATVLAVGSVSYLLFFQSPYANVELSGTVTKTNAQGLVLRSVDVSSGPTPCTTDSLQILASRSELDPGDEIQIKGRYNSSSCEVELTKSSHQLTVVSQSPEPIQLQGDVTSASDGSFVLNNVNVNSGPEPCTTDDLEVVASSIDASQVETGDAVKLEGLYDVANCQVQLSQSSHTLEITAQAPDPIQLEGFVSRTISKGVMLKKVSVVQGPSPCTSNALQVRIPNSVLAPEELLTGDKVSVSGTYHYKDCYVTVEEPQHSVSILPVPIELTGIVTELQDQRLTLAEVSVNQGPSPCSTSSLTISASHSPVSLPKLQTGLRVNVSGEYFSPDCEVRISSRTHQIAAIPSPITVEGVIASTSGQGFNLRNVTVQSGPMPCSTSELPVRTNGRIDMSQIQKGLRTEVQGSYEPNNCEIVIQQRDHAIALQPTQIHVQGSVNAAGTREMRLNNVSTIEGPEPCRRQGIDVTSSSSFHWEGREQAQQHGSRLELEGLYDSTSCEIVDAQILDVLDVPETQTATQAGEANVGGSPGRATPVWQRFMGAGGLVLMGDNKLYTGALGFEAFNSVFLKIGMGFGSGQTTNEHGIPIDLEFQAYGLGAFYEISDHFVIGGAGGLLSITAKISDEWSEDKSVPFFAVMGGVKFGPAMVTGGGALPLD